MPRCATEPPGVQLRDRLLERQTDSVPVRKGVTGYRSTLWKGFAIVALLICVPSVRSIAQARCGVERWPVKILGDLDSERVALRPIVTTVAKLAAVERPLGPFRHDRRETAVELTTFLVRARFAGVWAEADGDLHIVLRDLDDSTVTIVAEIPDSACAVGSAKAAAFAEARRALRETRLGTLLEAIGVGFFDNPHGQRGGSPNGIELHPILSIRRLTDPDSGATFWPSHHQKPARR